MEFERPKVLNNRLKLRVHVIQQMSGSFQHVTVYEAEMELREAGVEVEVLRVEVASAEPMEPDPDDVDAARVAILEGARDVLGLYDLGARIRVMRMLLHPVDFQARQFRRHTAIEIGRLLAEL